MGVCAASAATAAALPMPYDASPQDQVSSIRQTVGDSQSRMPPTATVHPFAGQRQPAKSTPTANQDVPFVTRSKPYKPNKRSNHYFRDMDCPPPHMRHPYNGSCRTPAQHDAAKREAEWLALFAMTAGAAASLYAETKCIKLLDAKREERHRKTK